MPAWEITLRVRIESDASRMLLSQKIWSIFETIRAMTDIRNLVVREISIQPVPPGRPSSVEHHRV